MNENFAYSWLDVTVSSVQGLWDEVLYFLPSLIGALIVLIIGLVVASVLARLVEKVLFYLKIDNLLKRADVEQYFHRANMKIDTGHFFGQLIYWFVLVAFLLAASDILRFTAFSGFLESVLLFIPDVVIAALILLATLVIANFLKKLVVASASSAKLHHAGGIGLVVWWAIFIFGFVPALSQLGINIGILNTLITGLIAMLALAGGLAFGLGGKEHAGRFLTKVSDHMRR